MNCPVDDSELRITERQGIEIDYCPKCRGVWLDRGELDKLIDRASSPVQDDAPILRDRDHDRDRDRVRDDDRWRERERDDDDDRPRRPKRKSLLSELFDID